MSWTIDSSHSQVNFSARHMGIMTVRGHFNDIQATIDFNQDDFTASSVEASINAASLVTNDAKRDEHLRSADFLDVEKYPTITFKSTKIERAEHDRYRMTGDLTIHGVTRPVTLDVVYSGQIKDPWGNARAGFSAETTIRRSDWGISFNAVLETGGLVVSDEVKIALDVEAVKPAEVLAAA
ncbi:MAG TPA: YceI family protein [Chloroflexota bacterium]|nr:YceI family protein [Chloroflexota bacterium]